MIAESSRTRGGASRWLVVTVMLLSLVALPAMSAPASAAGDAQVAITNVSVSPTHPSPDSNAEIQTTIRNGEDSPQVVEITDLYIRQPGNPSDIARAENLGTLPTGESISVPLLASFEETGVKELRVTVVGTQQQDNERVRVTYPLTVDVREPEPPQLELSVEEAVPGGVRSVNVTVANGLERDIRQLRLTVGSEAVDFESTQRVQARLAGGETTVFELPARVQDAGTYPVNVTLRYSDQGETRVISHTFEGGFTSPSNPGEILLTDASAVDRGGTLEISATAGNIGSSAVSGVVVSTGNNPDVAAANYFVGSIDRSDFATFTLSASVDGNVSTVPVEVSYVVDGVRRTHTTSIDVQRVVQSRPTPDSGGGLPLLPIVGAVVLLGVAGGLYRRYR
jgi:hypothetical protein